MKSLLVNPIEYYSCFISYSSKDEEFAKRLHAALRAAYVCCWFAPEDLRIGERFRRKIDEAIRVQRFVKVGAYWKLTLRTAKTGVNVYVPLQKEVVQAIDALPGKHPFWSGKSTAENCSSVWQEAYRKLFKHAGIEGHPHRFRHTFAKNLLVNEVPLETVSLLLGHKRLAITEKHCARFVPERQALVETQIRKTGRRTGDVRKSTSK